MPTARPWFGSNRHSSSPRRELKTRLWGHRKAQVYDEHPQSFGSLGILDKICWKARQREVTTWPGLFWHSPNGGAERLQSSFVLPGSIHASPWFSRRRRFGWTEENPAYDRLSPVIEPSPVAAAIFRCLSVLKSLDCSCNLQTQFTSKAGYQTTHPRDTHKVR